MATDATANLTTQSGGLGVEGDVDVSVDAVWHRVQTWAQQVNG